MPLDVLSSGLHTPEPLGPILDQQPLDQVLGGHLHVPWPLKLPGEDLLVDPERVVVVERWITWNMLASASFPVYQNIPPPVSCLFGLRWVNTKTEAYDPRRHHFEAISPL